MEELYNKIDNQEKIIREPQEKNKFYPNELTTEILDELWLDMSFHKDYIKHKYEFYKLRDTYYLLQQENEQLKIEKELLKERIAYLERSNNRRETDIIELRDEQINSEICRENWNKLKEWLNEGIQRSADLYFQVLRKSTVLEKMQELEKGSEE